jgi:membrane protein YqaA with SNARE-associated domain
MQQTPAEGWLRRIARARYGPLVLYWFSVLEAAFVPIPFETVLAPYMHMRPDIRWRLAALGVAGYATVAMIGFALGAFFLTAAAEPLIDRLGWRDDFDEVSRRLSDGGFWMMVVIVALPLPTMVTHIAAGAVGMAVEQVLLAVLLVRGARYFGVGILVALYGDRVVAWFRGKRAAARLRREARRAASRTRRD